MVAAFASNLPAVSNCSGPTNSFCTVEGAGPKYVAGTSAPVAAFAAPNVHPAFPDVCADATAIAQPARRNVLQGVLRIGEAPARVLEVMIVHLLVRVLPPVPFESVNTGGEVPTHLWIRSR